MIFYPKPLHKPPVANEESNCPVAERVCNRILSLPICPYMTDLEQEKVITSFLKIVRGKKRINRVSGGNLVWKTQDSFIPQQLSTMCHWRKYQGMG